MPPLKNARNHLRLARNFFPDYDETIINEINRQIDNPSGWDINVENARKALLDNFGEVPTMNRSGHRRYCHDLATAVLKGYNVAGADGTGIAIIHLGADVLKDNITRLLGTDLSNVLENIFVDSIEERKREQHS